MSGDGVSEAVAAAFGRAPRASSDAVAVAFGRPTVAQESLMADLVSAGYSERGARGVVSRLGQGFPADLALSGMGFGGEHDQVTQRVRESALGVLVRHGRVVEESTQQVTGLSSAVAEARDRLASAYLAGSPQYGAEGANRYAETAVESWLESGSRQGWSESQVVEALDRQRYIVISRAARKVARR